MCGQIKSIFNEWSDRPAQPIWCAFIRVRVSKVSCSFLRFLAGFQNTTLRHTLHSIDESDMYMRFCYIAQVAAAQGIERLFATDSDVVFTSEADVLARNYPYDLVSPLDTGSQFVLGKTVVIQEWCEYMSDFFHRPLEDLKDWAMKYGTERGSIPRDIAFSESSGQVLIDDMVMLRGFAGERPAVTFKTIFPLAQETFRLGHLRKETYERVFSEAEKPLFSWAASLANPADLSVGYGDSFDSYDFRAYPVDWKTSSNNLLQAHYKGVLIPAFHFQGLAKVCVPAFLQQYKEALRNLGIVVKDSCSK